MLDPLNQVTTLTWAAGQCSAPVPDQRSADADRFVTSFGLVETVELTNIDNPGILTVNCSALNLALQDAFLLLTGSILEASQCGGEQIEASFQRWQVIIARHFLDVIRRRPEVRQDYEDVIVAIDKAKKAVCKGPRPKDTEQLGTRNIKFRAEKRVWNRDYYEREQF